MLFGNKEIFGIEIEYEEDSTTFAYIAIYVSNIYIGTLDDVTYLNSFLASFENSFCDVKELPLRLQQATPKDIFLERFGMENWNDDIDPFNIMLEDTFDPFSMMIYKSNNKAVFLWSLWSEHFRDKDYPKGIHYKEIDISYLNEVVNKCTDYYLK